MKISGLFLLILFLLVSKTSYGQSINNQYDIFLGSKRIGTLLTKNTLEGNISVYEVVSDAKVRFITDYKIKLNHKGAYENNILIYSHIIREINGKIKADCKVWKENNEYLNKSKSQKIKRLFNSISYSVIALYFIEPAGIQSVYSEYFGEFIPIRKINSNTYKIEYPDGSKSSFIYKGGICESILVENSLSTVTILKSNTYASR